MVLQFKVKIVAEHAAQPLREFSRAFDIARHNHARDIARKAGRETDQPVFIRFEHIIIDARFMVKPFGKADG